METCLHWVGFCSKFTTIKVYERSRKHDIQAIFVRKSEVNHLNAKCKIFIGYTAFTLKVYSKIDFFVKWQGTEETVFRHLAG